MQHGCLALLVWSFQSLDLAVLRTWHHLFRFGVLLFSIRRLNNIYLRRYSVGDAASWRYLIYFVYFSGWCSEVTKARGMKGTVQQCFMSNWISRLCHRKKINIFFFHLFFDRCRVAAAAGSPAGFRYPSDQEAHDTLRATYDLGIKYFDTAPVSFNMVYIFIYTNK